MVEGVEIQSINDIWIGSSTRKIYDIWTKHRRTKLVQVGNLVDMDELN